MEEVKKRNHQVITQLSDADSFPSDQWFTDINFEIKINNCLSH